VLSIQSLHHISLVVRDVAASKQFYCQVLNMQEAARPANFKFSGAWLRAGTAEIHLIQADDAIQAPGDGPAHPTDRHGPTFARHFCLQVNDVEQMLATLRLHNISIVAGPRPRGDGPTQTYVFDPDGHLVELVCLAAWVPPASTS
jgi:catechol 2,3-dioxygenase-like lactoylglutathione lyase family enzyme